ncbi:hypothetical protein DRF65_16125 [Chryseobacterium pennae]|uniref:Uncharacterized protein n=1 Tax=Chryseobacterium pennae TaxID=2258962 RepID=A0A3D9C6H2_9FLAO|nr:hypothetical protein [Chryseobacterium pennae]REC61463.1 hypothetical protein DRF65_16125 [Chryseobacterium pennae]
MNPFVTQEFIIKKIRSYNKDHLLNNLFYTLKQVDLREEHNHPLWHYFLLIKWTFLHGNENGKKTFSREKFITLLKYVEKFEKKSLDPYVKNHEWDKFFQIIGYQQFYLQQDVHWSDFARQLKLFGSSLKSKYDIEKSFNEKTKLKLFDFIFFMQIIWIFTQANKMNKGTIYTGYIGEEIFEMMKDIFNYEKEFSSFLMLLTLNKINIKKSINQFKTGIKHTALQSFEMSFFTRLPFIINGENKYEIVHRSIFNYCCNYFIYDYLKINDEKFTEEFGKRFEKYVELGLKECNVEYITEKDLIKTYGKGEKIVDYIVGNQVLIECKGIEPKPLSSIIPENEIVYSSFKDSIFKAYLQQMLNITKLVQNLNKPIYGIIICYKDFYLSSLDDYAGILANDIKSICEKNNWKDNPLPLENVFVISINNWDIIVEYLKEKKVTLPNLLNDIVNNNRIEKHKWFLGLLKQYGNAKANLSYLETENKTLSDAFAAPSEIQA